MNIRGALIEMIEYTDEQEKAPKCYNAFLELKCSKMIILRELDADKYLVAICRDTPQFNWELMWTINESIYKADFEELYQRMNGKPLQEMDEIIYAVCNLCRDHEKAGFMEGIKAGIHLAQELFR